MTIMRHALQLMVALLLTGRLHGGAARTTIQAIHGNLFPDPAKLGWSREEKPCATRTIRRTI